VIGHWTCLKSSDRIENEDHEIAKSIFKYQVLVIEAPLVSSASNLAACTNSYEAARFLSSTTFIELRNSQRSSGATAYNANPVLAGAKLLPYRESV